MNKRIIFEPDAFEIKDIDLGGFWFRRINDEHRLIYTVNDTEIIIAACKDHYDD